MNLADIYREETVVEDLQGTTKEEVIEEMVGVLEKAKLVPVRKSAEVLAALVRREEMGSTGIGRGVGVPHIKHACVKDLVGVFGRSKRGVEFQALDGAPVHLVFLLISPLDSVEPHLMALKKISALSADNDMRRFLNNAEGRSEIVDLLKEADGRVEV